MVNSERLYNAVEFNNIKEIIYNSAKVYSEKIAYVIKHVKDSKAEYENITYKRLLEDVNKLGTALYNMGMKGKRIAIIGKNRYEWAITYLANLLGGIVAVPLDKDLQYDELENSLIRSKADCIFFDEKLIERVSTIKDNKKTSLSEYVCMGDAEGYRTVHGLLIKGGELLGKGDNEYINAEIDENVMNTLLFTSGTTSESKAVMLSQKNIASNIYAMQCVEDIRPTDTNIAFLPFHHIFGSTGMIMMLASGVKTAFPDGLKYIKQNLNEYKVSLFIGVPVLVESIYKTVMKEIDKKGKTKLIKIAVNISNFLLKFKIDIRRNLFKEIIDALGGKIRMIISGGAPADAKISKGFIDFGIKVVQGYGLSETAPVIAAENAKYVKNGSVGKAMINDELEIVNKDENGIGELRVKGPNVMLGYYEMPELTKQVMKDGWFYTGDLAYIDKDGYIFITGRNKNMIVLRNGKKIFPEEIETLISRLEFVEECIVFGLPEKNDKNDLKLAVKVVYNKAELKNRTEKELYEMIWEQIKKVNKTLPKYKYIQKLILTNEELIKTTTKKVKRNEEIKKILGAIS